MYIRFLAFKRFLRRNHQRSSAEAPTAASLYLPLAEVFLSAPSQTEPLAINPPPEKPG
jgi:hypothetical protein